MKHFSNFHMLFHSSPIYSIAVAAAAADKRRRVEAAPSLSEVVVPFYMLRWSATYYSNTIRPNHHEFVCLNVSFEGRTLSVRASWHGPH